MSRTASMLGIGACLMAMTTTTHAATPMTLPFGELGLQPMSEIALPVPPPPQVARPDVTRMRIVIKPQPARGCDGDDDTRRPAGERRQTALSAAVIRPVRLG